MQRARNLRGASPLTKAVAAGAAAPSCAVVGESELQRIQDIADQKARNAAEAEKARREQLRQTSEGRVAHWPNTIEAQRLRKETMRKERAERDEERRRAIDEEEEALRSAQKAQAIQKANMQLYEENDKVKNFTSKLFLATVLEEREKQLAIKDERKRLLAQQEMEWAVQEEAALRKAEEAELTKAELARSKIHALKAAQLEQLAGIRRDKIRARDAGVSEGQSIKAAAQQAVREEEEAEAQRREAQRQAAKDFIAVNEVQLAQRTEVKRREDEENARIASFAAAKEAQMIERKTRADEKFAAKLRRRQELIDLQAQQLAEIKAATEERELKAMRDFDRERQDRERRGREQRERLQRDIENFRTAQLAHKATQKQKEDAERARIQTIWRDRAELLVDEELHERREQRERLEGLQHFHVLQAQEKRHQSLLEQRRDIEEGIHLQEALREEQDMYNGYVNSVMAEYVAKGRGSDLVRMAASRAKAKPAE